MRILFVLLIALSAIPAFPQFVSPAAAQSASSTPAQRSAKPNHLTKVKREKPAGREPAPSPLLVWMHPPIRRNPGAFLSI